MKNSANTHQLPLIIITPFFGSCEDNLYRLKNQLITELNSNDKWIIVYDNTDPKNFLENENEQIIILQNNSIAGAGNTRNIALEFIQKNLNYNYLLYPVDSDDEILPNSIYKIKKAFEDYQERVITFGHIKSWKQKHINIGYEGIFNLRSLLMNYITPCGSTIIKINSKADLNNLRFGHRKRANDQLFFLNAVKKFKSFRSIREPILLYKIIDSNSVSSKKYKMIFYKYLALRDFGISRLMSIYYMFYYAYHGFVRHILKIGVEIK